VAYHKSAAKRARQNVKKNAVNSSYVNSVRTVVKGFRKLIEDIAAGLEKDASKVQPLFMQAQSKIMKAATKGLLHKNSASRTVAKLAHLLKKSASATPGEVTAATSKAKPAVKKAPAKTAPAKASSAKKATPAKAAPAKKAAPKKSK
jgi:small subunit ribosomal protein S20